MVLVFINIFSIFRDRIRFYLFFFRSRCWDENLRIGLFIGDVILGNIVREVWKGNKERKVINKGLDIG